MIIAIQFAAIPAMIIIVVSALVRRSGQEEPSASQRWFSLLLALSAGIQFLLYLFSLLFPHSEMRFGYFLAVASLPVLLGMLALLLLDVRVWASIPMT